MIRREVWYFDRVGPENTEACIKLLAKAVSEGYTHLVVASTTGEFRGPGGPAPGRPRGQPGGGGPFRGL